MKRTQHAENIFTIDNFLSASECKEYIDLSENMGYEAAEVNTGSEQKVISQVRNNTRAFHKNERLANFLWEKAQPYIPPRIGNSLAIGLNELFRFYRYEPGQKFIGHKDESSIRNEKEASYFTFMVCLNDDFEGGEITFSGLWLKPKQGAALIYLHELDHSGKEVTKGTKYVLRTDVMYRLVEDSVPVVMQL